jgi:hypothetical protein
MGPVSEVLLGELKEQVRQHGVVVWLDPASTYSGFADAHRTDPARVVRYRGSFARLLREAAPYAREATPTPLVIHLAGMDEAALLDTPALEIGAAGKLWQRDLKDLVIASAAGRVSAEDLRRFVAEVATLEEADAWLADRLVDLGGGLAAILKETGLPEIIDQLLDSRGLAARVAYPSDVREIWSHLHKRVGLPSSWWEELTQPDERLSARDVADALASWALCVEYIHDPAPRTPRAKILEGVDLLPSAVVNNCRKLASALRDRKDDFYQRTADETEVRIPEERKVDAHALGHIDTFRFEEDAVLRAALGALDPEQGTDDPEPVLQWAEGRAERSYWLRLDDSRRMAWRLVLDAGRVMQAILLAGVRLDRAFDLAGAVRWYTERGSRVDLYHRILEQDTALLLKSELPEYDALAAAIEHVRASWAAWAENIAEDFNAICSREGFLPEKALQQRTLFDDVVMAGLDDGVTAYFMVDAFRYEMAEALRSTFDGAGTTVQLTARLAELPSVTEVGMNALAPVMVSGKLHAVIADGGFGGFQVGEYRVKDPGTRKRAIHARAGGATCPWLSLKDAAESDPKKLRKTLAQAKIVVVHSTEIDTAGESGVGLPAFEVALRQLREAWLRLRDAGVRRFVITADHGFLLLRSPQALEHGLRNIPSRRHAVSAFPAMHRGEVQVPLSSLQYEGATHHLMMPSGLHVFRTFQSGQEFVHGGNSLQERVIPVLVVTSKTARGEDLVSYELQHEPMADAAGFHRVRVTVVARGELFTGGREVDVVLRAREAEGVAVEVWVGNERAEGQLRVKVGVATELYFRLRGGAVPRVAVEVGCAGGVQATPVMAGFYSVIEQAASKGVASSTGVHAWLDAIADADHRQVLAHVVAHGSITEAEVATLIGSASKARRFGAALDALLPETAPIRVRVDTVAGVKRYVREEG